MLIQSAIRKLEKNGYTVTNDGSRYTAKKANNRRFIAFIANGGEWKNDIAVIEVRTEGNEDDIYSDYHAGTFVDNITQAMRIAAC